jgi:hypothetical protein
MILSRTLTSITGRGIFNRALPVSIQLNSLHIASDKSQPPHHWSTDASKEVVNLNWWKPAISSEDQAKLSNLKRANQKHLSNPKYIRPPARTQTELSDTTKECLSRMASNFTSSNASTAPFYSIIEINTKPFMVSTNDVVITKRLPGNVQVGDELLFTRIREIGRNIVDIEKGTESCFIRGNPIINPEYLVCKGVVIEHCLSARYTKYLKRRGKGGGDRKWRKRSYRDHLSVVRITELGINNDILSGHEKCNTEIETNA